MRSSKCSQLEPLSHGGCHRSPHLQTVAGRLACPRARHLGPVALDAPPNFGRNSAVRGAGAHIAAGVQEKAYRARTLRASGALRSSLLTGRRELLRHAKIVDFRASQVAAWAVRAAIGVRLEPSTPRSPGLRTVVVIGGGLATAAVVVTSAKVRDLRLRGRATERNCGQRGAGASFYMLSLIHI